MKHHSLISVVMLFLLFLWAPKIYSQTDTSIRRIDWNSFLTKDKKHFTICTNCDHNSIQPVFTINGTDNEGGIGNVSYLDFNHDNREDAIVQLWMDGTGHCGSFVLFLQSSTGPIKSTHDGDCHFGVTTTHDTILVTRALFGPMEPNCCPGEYETTPIVWRNSKVHRLKSTIKPTSDSPIEAVESFYRRINGGLFEVAYDFLSSDYKKKNPYKRWVDGYKNTKSVSVDIDSTITNDRVKVRIQSIDAINNNDVHRQFEGSWKVILDTTNPYHIRWQLSDPKIREIK